VVRAATVSDLLDAAALLDAQPLPDGDRVGVVSNSNALARLVERTLPGAGLVAGPVQVVPVDSGAEQYRPALSGALADADALIAVFVPPLGIGAAEVGAAVAEAARSSGRPIAATFLGQEGIVPELGTVPAYSTPESAVAAMGRVREHARWRNRPVGIEVDLDADRALARNLVDAVAGAGTSGGGAGGLADHADAAGPADPSDAADPADPVSTPNADELRRSRSSVAEQEAALGDSGPLPATRSGALDVSALLGAYGIAVVPAYPAPTAAEAVRVADRVGWPVVLKTTDAAYRHRSDLGAVRLDLTNPEQLRSAWQSVTDQLRKVAEGRGDEGSGGDLVVQKMAPLGVPVVVGAVEDPRFGPLVSFAVGGIASELLGDTVWRMVPLLDADAEEMVRAPRAAPLLSGYRGAEPADLPRVQDLLLRVAQLKDDLPEVASVELNPVLVTADGLHVLGAAVHVGPPVTRLDYGPRRML
jgi:acyl-CoA synthetase (NDP forming)